MMVSSRRVSAQDVFYFNARDTSSIQFLFDTTLVFYDQDGNELPAASEIARDTMSLGAFGPASKILIKRIPKRPGKYVIYAGKLRKGVYKPLVFEVDTALTIKILSHRQYHDYEVTHPGNIHFVVQTAQLKE